MGMELVPETSYFFKYSDAAGSPRRLNQYVSLLNFFTDFRTAYDTIN
jgi:hypothetical protein